MQYLTTDSEAQTTTTVPVKRHNERVREIKKEIKWFHLKHIHLLRGTLLSLRGSHSWHDCGATAAGERLKDNAGTVLSFVIAIIKRQKQNRSLEFIQMFPVSTAYCGSCRAALELSFKNISNTEKVPH